MSDPAREAAFTEWLLGDMPATTKELGYYPSYFIRMVEDLGGLETCKRLINAPGVSTGFCRLRELGRLDLSVEAIVLDERWTGLFTGQEHEIAQWRLDNAEQLCSE